MIAIVLTTKSNWTEKLMSLTSNHSSKQEFAKVFFRPQRLFAYPQAYYYKQFNLKHSNESKTDDKVRYIITNSWTI